MISWIGENSEVNDILRKEFKDFTLEDCLELARKDFDIVTNDGLVVGLIYNNTNEED